MLRKVEFIIYVIAYVKSKRGFRKVEESSYISSQYAAVIPQCFYHTHVYFMMEYDICLKGDKPQSGETYC